MSKLKDRLTLKDALEMYSKTTQSLQKIKTLLGWQLETKGKTIDPDFTKLDIAYLHLAIGIIKQIEKGEFVRKTTKRGE